MVPGESHDQSAYRRELAGQLGIAAILSHLQIETGNYRITTSCDRISALSRVGMSTDYIKCSMKHADVISYISSLWGNSNFTPNRVHVYGHQDDYTRPLTILEYLNCEMDELANLIARNQMIYNKKNFITTTLGLGSVSCNGKLIVSKIRASLYSTSLQQKNLTFLSDKLGIDNDSLVNDTSWKSYGYARKESSWSTQKFITKWMSGDTATGRVMVQRKQRLSSNCPICGSIDEHNNHVLTCRNPKVTDLHSNLIEELNAWLCTVNTYPDLQIYIISSLEQWFKYPDSDYYNILDNDDTASHAFRCQNKLGIYALLLGFISKHIISTQQAHYPLKRVVLGGMQI